MAGIPAVFKRDRHGTLLDAKGAASAMMIRGNSRKAVHMASIHMDKGMHCVDCHYARDNHGNGYITARWPRQSRSHV